jgi:hypothetical protein
MKREPTQEERETFVFLPLGTESEQQARIFLLPSATRVT